MKKSPIFACLLVAACCANAATFKWQTSYEVADATQSGITSATMAYLIDPSVLSQSAIWDAVANNGKTLAAAIGDNAIASASMSGGKITTMTAQELPTSYVAETDMSAYMVLFDANIEGGSLYFSEQLTRQLQIAQDAKFEFESNSSLNKALADMTSFNASEGAWVTAPEPTSGLLVLMGLAGLMLRRKRA